MQYAEKRDVAFSYLCYLSLSRHRELNFVININAYFLVLLLMVTFEKI